MKITSLILSFMASASAYCQTTMSLTDCLAYAKEHSISNRIEQMNANSTRMDVREHMWAFAPYINAGAGAGLNFGRGIDPETNTYTVARTLGESFGIEATLPLFDGLVNVNTLRATKMANLQARSKVEMQTDKTALIVVRQYYNVCYYQALAQQAQRQLKADQEQLRLTRRQEELGQKSGVDTDEMAATVATSELQLLQQNNLLEQAEIELKYAMNYPMDSVFTVLSPDKSTPLSVPESFKGNIDAMPQVEAARLDMETAHYQLKAARGRFSPNISVSAGINTNYFRTLNTGERVPDFSQQIRDNLGKYISVNISIPIFDRFGTRFSVGRRKATYHSQQLTYEDTKRTVEKEMRQAWMDLNASLQEYISSEASLTALNTSHRANTRKYELGQLSALELQASSAKRANAEAVATGKLINYYIKQIEWNYYNNIKIW